MRATNDHRHPLNGAGYRLARWAATGALAVTFASGAAAPAHIEHSHPYHVAATANASAALAALPIRAPMPSDGYRRRAFGPAWADIDHDGCDQRNQTLARDMEQVRYRPGSTCVVASGVLHDPYTGRRITFTRGQHTSDAVQIDHVVSLAAAWRTGAQLLDQPTRERLAGDPMELIAVTGPVNQAKGDSDAEAWLPPDPTYQCPYVARQIKVKQTYRLWVTPGEHAVMRRVLAGCPHQSLPDDPAARRTH